MTGKPHTSFWTRLIETPSQRLTLALLALCALVYVPFAGNYGMWDPWETHYGEVARQMLERNDFVSQYWPGSPQDRAEFWSKPVLTFWLMAISMKLFGLQWNPGSPAGEMASSWRAEWACRLPFVVLGIIGVWATYTLVRRLIGRRPAAITALVLLTSTQWALISRQAMTDMAFVVPMTVALVLAGLGLMLPHEEIEAELPRKKLFGPFSIPDTAASYGLLGLLLLAVVPQLVVMSVQVQLSFHLKSSSVKIIGLVPMLPYWAALGVVLWSFFGRGLGAVIRPITNRRQLYLTSAWLLCGLASLAKGPAGLAIPAIILGVYLVVTGRIRDIWLKMELARGAIVFIASAFPWYHSMLIRHAMGFWNEFIGDNYVRRAGGRHGDRGTFEYYLQYIGYGMFPWSGFVAVGSITAFRALGKRGPRAKLAAFAIVWALVDWALVTLVNTKFHHYILPALPALAILAALCLDDLLTKAEPVLVTALLVVGVPLTFLCGRDLAAFPPRILWMFNYDYVNIPGTGRPWPIVSIYGDRYEYGSQLLVLAVAATIATIAIVWAARRVQPILAVVDAAGTGDGEEALVSESEEPVSGSIVPYVAGFFVLLVAAIAFGPATPAGKAPEVSRWLWLAPTACMLPFVPIFLGPVLRELGPAVRAAVVCMGLLAVVWTGFVIDKMYIELSPHWAQKHVIASYYANRRSPDEKLVAWQLYWRGENFYTKNEIYKDPNPLERTIFLGDRNIEKMQKWYTTHTGQRVFFLIERVRLESLRGTLPAASRPSLQIIDQSNNKLYLCVAQL